MLYGVLRIRINPRFISLSCLSQGFSDSLKGCNARAAAEIVLAMREYRRYKGISLEHVQHISFPFLLFSRFLVKRSINYGPSLAIIYTVGQENASTFVDRNHKLFIISIVRHFAQRYFTFITAGQSCLITVPMNLRDILCNTYNIHKSFLWQLFTGHCSFFPPKLTNSKLVAHPRETKE